MNALSDKSRDELLLQVMKRRLEMQRASDDLQKEEQKIRSAERFKKKFFSFFPDLGPLRRELYPKHMQFFSAGATFRERSFNAGNRCVTPWTPIQTDHATRLPLEMLSSGDVDVRSWDGGSRCNKRASGVFLKGIEPAFRILMDNGEAFDCSHKHLVLTLSGWLSVGRLVSQSSGLRCWKRPEGYPASYGTESCLGGLQPRLSQDTDQGRLPSLDGAPIRRRSASLRQDEEAPIFQRSHAFPAVGLPSILDDPIQISDLCGGFEDPGPHIDALWPTRLLLELGRFVRGSYLQKGVAGWSDRADWLTLGNAFRDASQRFGQSYTEPPIVRLSPSLNSLWTSGQEFLEAYLRTEILFPLLPPLPGGNYIVAVIPIGFQPIVDFTVDETHCYETAGVIHHNTGKTESGAFESTCHLTGRYPKWWKGRTFSGPTRGWACGSTNITARDIVQRKLLGQIKRSKETLPGDTIGLGTGMIPGADILDVRPKPGVPDAIESVYVRHKSGGTSMLNFKSYEAGSKAFEGTEQDFIWLDEEPDQAIYTECLVRTMTCNGIIYLTMTPLLGLSAVVLAFLPGGQYPEDGIAGNKFVVMCDWNEVPHLTEEAKKDLWESIPPYQRDARSKGVPQIGSGQIYPIPESEIVVPRFNIPPNWRKAYGLDVGWNRTAALWIAEDPASKVWTAWSEHYVGREEPSIQVQAIRSRGKDIPGVIDPAARGRSQKDGEQLLQIYKDLGLDLKIADNRVESGIYDVWQALAGGMLKIMDDMRNTLEEYRVYRRDVKGHIVKEKDHCFTPDTLVATPDGPRRIDSSPQKVIGPDGSVLSVSRSWRTGTNQLLVRLTFDDGASVRCTSDHKFLTVDGWVKAEDMEGRCCDPCISQSILNREWANSKLGLFRQRFRSLRGFVTTCAESTFSAMGSVSMSPYGPQLMAENQGAGTISTTSTVTDPITPPGIWKRSTSPSTSAITIGGIPGRYLLERWKRLRHGTDPKKVRDGTMSTIVSTEKACTGEGNSLAATAGSRSRLLAMASALMYASQNIAVSLALTMRNELAWLAARLLSATVTTRPECAQGNALIRCVRVEPAGSADVYCLSVPGKRSFCLENGIVVHNCMDSLRYVWCSGRDRAQSSTPEVLFKERQSDPWEGRPNSWMA